MKQDSYWLDTAPAFTGGTLGDLPPRTDVVVIGGGFTGLSAALALVRRGASVVVLEGGRVIGQASGRNGGHCNNGTSQDFATLSARYGPDRARRFWNAYDAAVESVAAVIAREGIDCDFRRNGKIKLAAKPEHFAKLEKAYHGLRDNVDADVELVPANRIRDEVGSDRYHGGLVQKKGAQMHMGRFGIGLAHAAVRAGAQVFESALVTGLARQPGGGYQVVSPRGTLQASQVLLATGCSNVGPFKWWQRRIVPVGSFIVVTEPLSVAQLDRIMPTRRNCVTTKHIGNYFRTTPDDRLLFGGRARFAMSNPTSDLKSGDILRATMQEVFPDLQQTRIDYCWGGMVDMTAERLPHAGERDGLYYAMGYSGHGVQMSVHMGGVMADVMNGTPQANPWGDREWPSLPGYSGKPWFLPLAGLYYRMKDLVG
jgi:glycine/D-amino acid oxidase-like deaminating enzyme